MLSGAGASSCEGGSSGKVINCNKSSTALVGITVGVCGGTSVGLNENWFMSVEDARCKIEGWRIHYNQSLPHSALCWIIPSEFAEKSAGCQNMQPE